MTANTSVDLTLKDLEFTSTAKSCDKIYTSPARFNNTVGNTFWPDYHDILKYIFNSYGQI